MQINSEIKTVVGIVLACLILIGLFVWFGPKSLEIKRDLSLLVKPDSYMTGKFGAKVTLVEFADFQCPACAQYAPFVKQTIDEFKSNPDFNFVFRHFPLSQHANAVISAEAVEAAGAQGKFFEMVEKVYENQDHWAGEKDPISLFVGYAQTLGLDTKKFRSDLETHIYQDKVKADLADSVALKLDHTPTFFLNGVEVKDVRTLKVEIEKALTK